jgi:uncharacterized membrane protein
MKVNYKKLMLWLVVLIVWAGSFTVLNYAVEQQYGKNVATRQFDRDTTAYKELRTQNKVEDIISVIGIAGGLLFLGLAVKQVKFKKE